MLKRLFALMILLLLTAVSAASAQDGGSTLQAWADTSSSAFNISEQIEWPNYTVTFSAINTYDNVGDPVLSCVPTHQYSVWHTFVAPQTGNLVVETRANNLDMVVAVYKTAPTAANETNCANALSTAGSWEFAFFKAQAGTRYYVVFAAAGSGIGIDSTSQITMAYHSNSFSSHPFRISPSGSYSNIQNRIETAYSSTVSGVDCPDFSRVVYYSFRPSVTGSYEFSTSGSNYDTIISLYTNDDYVICNDDISVNNRNSRLRRRMQAGQTYMILIGQSSTAAVVDSDSLLLSLRVRKL